MIQLPWTKEQQQHVYEILTSEELDLRLKIASKGFPDRVLKNFKHTAELVQTLIDQLLEASGETEDTMGKVG